MAAKNSTKSVSGSEVSHAEANDTYVGGAAPIVLPNLASNQKPQTDGFIANTTGFAYKWTGWAGQNGPPPGR